LNDIKFRITQLSHSEYSLGLRVVTVNRSLAISNIVHAFIISTLERSVYWAIRVSCTIRNGFCA